MSRSCTPGGALRCVAAVALVFGIAFASRPAAAQPVTITFANWAAAEGTTKPAIDKVIAEFEASHPDIRIRSEAISFSEIARQLALRVRAGNPPDVAQLAGNDTFLIAATGKLEPLGGYIDAKLKSEIKPDALTGLSYQGKLIAFPWTLAPAGLWYDKTILQKAGLDPEKPPKTIDELTTAIAAIRKTQPDVIPLGLDTTNRPFALQSNWPWMATFGADPLGAGHADSAQMKRYLGWMRDLAKNRSIDPGRKIGEFRPLAAQDKVAFIWDQVLLQGVIQSASKMSDAEFDKRWGVTTQPAGPTGKSFSFEGGHQLVMFADSKQKKAAWAFIQYLATSPAAIRDYTLGPGASLPPLVKMPTPELAAKLDTPIYRAFATRIIPTVTTPPYGPAFAAASSAIMAGVQQAVTGSESIDAIAGSIKQQLSR
jgi:multiple sugar transport system substrate-binding protein